MPNPDQQDSDHDGKGDACDGDNDEDNTPGDQDNAQFDNKVLQQSNLPFWKWHDWHKGDAAPA